MGAPSLKRTFSGVAGSSAKAPGGREGFRWRGSVSVIDGLSANVACILDVVSFQFESRMYKELRMVERTE